MVKKKTAHTRLNYLNIVLLPLHVHRTSPDSLQLWTPPPLHEHYDYARLPSSLTPPTPAPGVTSRGSLSSPPQTVHRLYVYVYLVVRRQAWGLWYGISMVLHVHP